MAYHRVMTPVNRCLRKVHHLSAMAEDALVDRLGLALDELERAYRKPSERVVALEAVLHGVERDPRRHVQTFADFVCTLIESRQSRWVTPA
ncbi:hypothetical protein [Methylorubrum sp. POS3]|uniref:hypothetical protein n=1 Tax=Methylorubrum sp. POS3 TaxID=2998492 RepID=UPI00372AB828